MAGGEKGSPTRSPWNAPNTLLSILAMLFRKVQFKTFRAYLGTSGLRKCSGIENWHVGGLEALQLTSVILDGNGKYTVTSAQRVQSWYFSLVPLLPWQLVWTSEKSLAGASGEIV